MAQSKGRPHIENPKNVRLEIRLTAEQSEILNKCAVALNLTRTDIITAGIQKVWDEIKE